MCPMRHNTFLSICTHLFFSGSESDSIDEPVVGNVNKFCVVPPGYSGRGKKGHLVFDACFESGKKVVQYNLEAIR